MPEYVVQFKGNVPDVVIEGTHLHVGTKEKGATAVITIFDDKDNPVAVFPTDAVTAVYQKDAEKTPPRQILF